MSVVRDLEVGFASRSRGRKLTLSSAAPAGDGCSDEIGAGGEEVERLTRAFVVVPAGMVPGQWAMNGTRCPPSNKSDLKPR